MIMNIWVRRATSLPSCSLRSHSMKQVFKDLLKIIKEQLFGEEFPRKGKLILSKKVSLVKIPEWGLSKETLELTFQYGKKSYVKDRIYQIVREYKYYSVGLWYIEEYRPIKGTTDVEKVGLVITCWKGSVRA
jgi:hypothetical protein